MKIIKNDKVIVTAGKDKGRQGVVEKVLISANKVVVAGINIYKRHTKKKNDKDKGGIVDFARPLPVSNVSLICPKCGKTTRVGYVLDKNGAKSRICKKCKEMV